MDSSRQYTNNSSIRQAGTTGTWQRVARVVPAVLLAVVATVQMGLAPTLGLTRWRGGGMGMYSEFHPNRTVVRALVGGELRAIDAVTTACSAAEWRATRMTVALDGVLDCVGPRADAVVAYRPRFDPHTRTWSMHEVARVTR